MDNQLPAALARWLSARADALHVLDCGLEATPDGDIWKYAIQESRIVVSKDEDFFHLANRPGDPGHLLWVRLGNCRTTVLLARFDAEWDRDRTRIQQRPAHRGTALTLLYAPENIPLSPSPLPAISSPTLTKSEFQEATPFHLSTHRLKNTRSSLFSLVPLAADITLQSTAAPAFLISR